MTSLYGPNYMYTGDTAGSSYGAASSYAAANGWSFRIYVPHLLYDPGPDPNGQVIPVLSSPFSPPVPGVLPYDPGVAKMFKAEFYDGAILKETWPDDYML